MQISLRSLLVIPFVLQVVGITTIVGVLSYRSGESAVEVLAQQLLEETTAQVDERLHSYLGTAHQEIARSRLALEHEWIETADLTALQNYFFDVLRLDNSYITLGYGSATGTSILVAWDEHGGGSSGSSYIAAETSEPGTGINRAYRLDGEGQRTELIQTRQGYDPRQLIWYQTAATKGAPGWTPIYPLVLKPLPAMLAVTPVYQRHLSPQGQPHPLAGVLFATVPMAKVSEFLADLDFAPHGQVFIIERSGDLVATSTPEEIYTGGPSTEPQSLARMNATQNDNPLTRAVAEKLFSNQQTLAATGPMQFSFVETFPLGKLPKRRRRYFSSVIPYQDAHGLDWLIVAVVPQADFMGAIRSNVRRTVLICGLAFLGTVGFGLWVTGRVLQAINDLNRATQKFAAGDRALVTEPTAIQEVESLRQAFHQMAHRLDESFKDLKTSEQRFLTLLENLPVGVGVFDLEGGVLWANPIAKQLVGQDLNDQNFARLSGTYQVYRANTNDPYPIEQLPSLRSLQGERVWANDIEIVNDQGQRTPLEVQSAPVLDAAGNIIASIVVFQDISDRLAMERLKNQYAQDLEQEVARKTAALEEAHRILEVQATTDSLTQIPNRYQLESFLELEWRRCQRDQVPLAILMVDVDHFKAYNDYYGHLQGDVCLHQVAQLLNHCVQRASDIVARYGGEEFVLVLPQIDARGAIQVAEQIQQSLLEANTPHQRSSVSDRITVSIGIAAIHPVTDTSPEEALSMADKALYEAKEHRNCYRIRRASGSFI